MLCSFLSNVRQTDWSFDFMYELMSSYEIREADENKIRTDEVSDDVF